MARCDVCSNLAQTASLLDSAAEQLMVLREFRTAFDTCESGLQSLLINGEEDRCGEIKGALCTLGIQALAELNQWSGVLPWVLQQYECPEKIPTKLMQMCILLYTKVGEQAMVQEASRGWLHCPSNRRQAGFRMVAELYLLHVLLPLGRTEEARELITGDVGNVAFAEDQRRKAFDILEVREAQSQRRAQPPIPHPVSGPEETTEPATPQGAVVQRLEAILRLLTRGLAMASTGTFPLRRVFLAVVLPYMLFIRMDPALPSSFPWISWLLQLLRQTWNAMVGSTLYSDGLAG